MFKRGVLVVLFVQISTKSLYDSALNFWLIPQIFHLFFQVSHLFLVCVLVLQCVTKFLDRFQVLRCWHQSRFNGTHPLLHCTHLVYEIFCHSSTWFAEPQNAVIFFLKQHEQCIIFYLWDLLSLNMESQSTCWTIYVWLSPWNVFLTQVHMSFSPCKACCLLVPGWVFGIFDVDQLLRWHKTVLLILLSCMMILFLLDPLSLLILRWKAL